MHVQTRQYSSSTYPNCLYHHGPSLHDPSIEQVLRGGAHLTRRERDEEKGQQREAPRSLTVCSSNNTDAGSSIQVFDMLFHFTKGQNPPPIPSSPTNRPKKKKEPYFHNPAPNHFNSSTKPHSVGESPKTNQELQRKTKLQDQTKRPKADTKDTCPSPKLQTFIDSDQKTKEGAMEEEWRMEERLAVVDEKNIPNQQEQQHQWRMNISNTNNEDDSSTGALSSGDGREARTCDDDEEQSKPRQAAGTKTTGAAVQAVVNGEEERFREETWEEEVKLNRVEFLPQSFNQPSQYTLLNSGFKRTEAYSVSKFTSMPPCFYTSRFFENRQ
ncbi:hypothetical protein V8G54_034144 [Vigna mungo]|uniref:Uncharacterized protein n=1 Tax=Vigna mungo TaxID=3915 RepID=A0AAQ3MPM6_VIGMU